MTKQLKLVINNRNEQVNYDSNGKESGSNTSASYNVVSETGEQIGYYPIVPSFDFTTNDIDESVTKAVVIWWNSSYIELSRLEVKIRKTDF